MKKILSIFLCILMVSTLIPIGTLSASADDAFIRYDEEEDNGDTDYANFIEENYEVYGSIPKNDADYFCFELTESTGVLFDLYTFDNAYEIGFCDSDGWSFYETYAGSDFNGIGNTFNPGVYYFYIKDFGERGDGDYSAQKYKFTYTFVEYCDHVFDNVCDKDCNKCSYVRYTPGHSFIFDTCTTPARCEKCGTRRDKAPGHIYENDCDTTCDLCYEKRSITHKYTNSCDTECNVCGYTRKGGHKDKSIVEKANFTKDGATYNKCSTCNRIVNKKVVSAISSVKLSKTSYTYNGKVNKPSVIVKDKKGNVIASKYYTVSYSTGCKNVGTYKVTVTFKTLYAVSKVLSYKINKQTSSNVTVTPNKTIFKYNGKVQTPTLTLKDSNGNTLKKDVDYKITLPSGRKKFGTYKIKITFKGNYSGTKSLSYKIAPTNKVSETILIGKTLKINAKSYKKITYTSSNKAVAKVNSKGVITALKAGKTVITVKSAGYTSKITVKVTNPSIKISAKSSSVQNGSKLQMKATTNPSGAKVTWSVNNKKLAKISSKGVLTPLKGGTVTVTASIKYRNKTYKTTYKVKILTEKPKISAFVINNYNYTPVVTINITNQGNKKLKCINKGSMVNSWGTKTIDKLSLKGYCDSITIDAGSVLPVSMYFKEGKVLMTTDTIFFMYFEYDGALYQARIDSGKSGINKCDSITLVD